MVAPTILVDSTAQQFGSDPQPEADIHCLHTTEGGSWPAYDGGKIAPHDTVMPLPGVGIRVRKHTPYTLYARALENNSTPGETNRRGVIQTELVGTCDPATHRKYPELYYWPESDDVVLEALAEFYRPVYERFKIPAQAPRFLAYPASYGASPVRMGHKVFDVYNGVIGHQHVPENSHGDPGAFPIDIYLAYITGVDDMSSVRIKNPFYGKKGFEKVPETWSIETAMGWMASVLLGMRASDAARDEALAQLQAGGSVIDYDKVKAASEAAIKDTLGALNDGAGA